MSFTFTYVTQAGGRVPYNRASYEFRQVRKEATVLRGLCDMDRPAAFVTEGTFWLIK